MVDALRHELDFHEALRRFLVFCLAEKCSITKTERLFSWISQLVFKYSPVEDHPRVKVGQRDLSWAGCREPFPALVRSSKRSFHPGNAVYGSWTNPGTPASNSTSAMSMRPRSTGLDSTVLHNLGCANALEWRERSVRYVQSFVDNERRILCGQGSHLGMN